MQFFSRILLLGLCATPWVSAVVYQDLDLGSIVIDDEKEYTFDILSEEVPTTQTPATENCQNSNGVGGTCMRIDECFPYLANQTEASWETYYPIYILKEVVKEAPESEGCPQKGLVCCPDFSSQKFVTKKPSDSPAKYSEGLYGIRENCGATLYNETERVVGGTPAKHGEFPFMVSLVSSRGSHFCGGSLLDSQWVLTAAHCIANIKNLAEVTVNVGDHDVRVVESTQQSRKVKRGFYHKGFSFNHLRDDIALLQLSSPVTFDSHVQPVCLSNTAAPTQEGKVVLCGWGKQGEHKPPAQTLLKVSMPIVPHATCQADYASKPGYPSVTENMMCAGEKQPLKDACNGDSGGPLSKIENGKALQVGVVSWGAKCGEKPGVFTRVDKYLAWINRNSP